MPLSRARAARIGLALLAFVALSGPRRGSADDKLTKNECVSASEKAIGLKSSGRLREARDQLVRCGREECPGILREDCAAGLKTLDDRLPTVVFGVRDDTGRDVVDPNARILVDDETGAGSAIDGRARTFDPGRHEVRIVSGKKVIATETVVLREGEKNRVVAVTLKREAKPKAEAAPGGGIAASLPPWLPYALGGVGLAGLGLAGGLSLHLDGRIDDAKATCAPGCSQDERASLSSQLVVANISLIVGLTALVAAGASFVLLRTQPSSPPPSAASLALPRRGL